MLLIICQANPTRYYGLHQLPYLFSLRYIQAGHRVSVMWVYLSRVKNWEELISDADLYDLLVPETTDEELAFNRYGFDPSALTESIEFDRFPHYPTVGAIQLTAEKANILADLSGWVVATNAELFRAALSG